MAPSGLKYPKPAPFSDVPNSTPTAREFLTLVRYYFNYYDSPELTDAAKLNFVAGLLTGQALFWLESVRSHMHSFAKFEGAFLAHFSPFPSVSLAREALYSLKFEGNVSAFAHAFRALVLEVPDISEADQAHLFVSRLPPVLAAEVKRRLLGKTTSLNLAIETAVLEETILDLSTTSIVNPGARVSEGTASPSQVKTTRVCYSCGKPGHIKKFCPNRKA